MYKIVSFSLIIIFCSPSLFAQTIDQDHTGTGTSYLSSEQSSITAQSFTAGISGLLNEIKIDIDAQFCPFNASLDTIAFAANLYDGNGTAGPLIASQNMVLNIPYARNLFPIIFDAPASVIAGNQYTIELRVNFGQICDIPFSIAINFVWYRSDSDSYASGQPYSSLSGSPTNDMYFQTFVNTASGISVNDINNSVTAYPNPAHDFISITNKDESKFTYQVVDCIGNIVLNETASKTGIIRADISDLTPGLYMVNINSDGIFRRINFVKE